MGAPLPLEPGRTLGRYQLKARLAAGGMAEVWLAEASGAAGFRKPVVLKTILPRYSGDPAFVSMLKNEATVAAALNHPGVVQILDLGAVDDTYFMAMEYVHGRTLRAVQSALQRQGRAVPPWLAFHVVMAVCDALDHAHNHRDKDGRPRGIVHRDVSPENVMIAFAGAIKVVDFGIARALDATPGRPPDLLKGKYPYMAPERIQATRGLGSDADPRSDVYSVGVVLFELLTGQLPFQAADDEALLARIVAGRPPSPRRLASGISEELERIMLQAIAADPAARLPSAAALRDELGGYLIRTGAATSTERHVVRVMATIFGDAAGLEPGARPGPPRPVEGETLELTPRSVPAAADGARTTPAPAAEGTVLVVDPDGVSRRFVELALAREGFQVESAKGAAAALEILQSTVIDLVICETDLPDMVGMQLHRRLQKERRLQAIPFVFLGADTRVATKVVALRAGVDDALGKPCDPAELAARVRALIERQRRQRQLLQARDYALAGDFEVLPIPDLVGMLEMCRRSGRLSVATRRATGEVLLENGRVVHASFGNLTGAAAFYRLMEEEKGRFELGAGSAEPTLRTMDMSATELLLEGARLLDTKRRDFAGAAAPAPAAAGAHPADAPAAPIAAAPSLSAALAAQFELGVRDAYCLGELRLLSGEELAAWTTSGGARDRFHVHLVANVPDGVAALLPLATPPGEREILSGLSAGGKLLGLDFFLRNERLLDLVLIDVRDPSAAARHLRRSPSLLILAPPRGDFRALGTGTVVGLDRLVAQLRPAAVLGLGGSTLEADLHDLSALRERHIPLRCVRGVLGDDRSDLREALVEGIRLRGEGAGG